MTTPAPWKVDRNTCNTLVTTRGATVALVMVNNNGDAELIAAAPDLLAALEDAQALSVAWVAHYQQTYNGGVEHPTHVELLARIAAAITKARGQ